MLVRQLPPSSRTLSAVTGGTSEWGPAEHLLALIADILQLANWQRSGRRKSRKPTPVARPKDRRIVEERRAEKARRLERLRRIAAERRARKAQRERGTHGS